MKLTPHINYCNSKLDDYSEDINFETFIYSKPVKKEEEVKVVYYKKKKEETGGLF